MKGSFSELRRSWELCFGYVSGLVGGNGNLTWISENLTWIFKILDVGAFELQFDRSLGSEGIERTDFFLRELLRVSFKSTDQFLDILRGFLTFWSTKTLESGSYEIGRLTNSIIVGGLDVVPSIIMFRRGRNPSFHSGYRNLIDSKHSHGPCFVLSHSPTPIQGAQACIDQLVNYFC